MTKMEKAMANSSQPSHADDTANMACWQAVPTNAVSRLPMLGGLPSTDLEWIRHHVKRQKLGTGRVLFSQDEEVRHFFFLESGSVKVSRILGSGQKKVMEIVNAGGFLALSALFLPQNTYTETTETLENSVLLRFETAPLLRALQSHPSTCMQLLEHMSKRLERKKQEIALLAESPAGSRLLQLLLEGIPDRAEPAGRFNISGSKRDIASRIAVKPETLSRLLKKMDAAGVLQNTTRGIVVTNVAELRRQAQRI